MITLLIALGVAFAIAPVLAIVLLRRRATTGPPLFRCANCGGRHGRRGHPIHVTPGEKVGWAILCEACWAGMPVRRRYEFYARQADRWGLRDTAEFAAIRASLEVGL